jgi:hypothetical protein
LRVAAWTHVSQRDAVDELEEAQRRVAAEAVHLGVQDARHGHVAVEPRVDAHFLGAGFRNRVANRSGVPDSLMA